MNKELETYFWVSYSQNSVSPPPPMVCVYYNQQVATRLLGRPQPQMYPPVARNQYTLVNRTHKHYIYMLQGPTNILKSHQSSTICKISDEVIWRNFFQIFVFILGGPGEAYVESRGIKVLWRPHHTGYICTTRKTMDNKFYIYVKTLTSLAKWGPGGGNDIFRVMLGPYIKSRGTRGIKMSANADLITVENYVQQGETIWKTFFHLWAKM